MSGIEEKSNAKSKTRTLSESKAERPVGVMEVDDRKESVASNRKDTLLESLMESFRNDKSKSLVNLANRKTSNMEDMSTLPTAVHSVVSRARTNSDDDEDILKGSYAHVEVEEEHEEPDGSGSGSSDGEPDSKTLDGKGADTYRTGSGSSDDLLGDSELHFDSIKEPVFVVYDDGKSRRRNKKLVMREDHLKKDNEKFGSDSQEWVEPDYVREDFISRPVTSTPNSRIRDSILQVYHSYGYDTHRRNNIHCLDENHILYIAGNYLHFYNIPRRELVFILRSASGYGLGHVAIHPSKQYFAVGEKGDFPFIMIYTWPDLKVFRVLRKGTTKGYAYIDFNPTGELLCSQGMEPDYLLTIWDWLHEKIILKYKAFSQDVYRATFSPTNPGDLTTSGLGHIRFWKMAETFTGLKLLGHIGRFGKTEISDIFGYAGISEGKVVSGSEWGNMLIWDGGLIVVEITQKEGKSCHHGEITDVLNQDTDILTIGRDGYICTWEAELLDLAALKVDEDIGKVEIEPNFHFRLGNHANLLSASRSVSDDVDNKTWYIQDAWGKVWIIDINAAALMISMAAEDYLPEMLFFAPGGPINGVGLSSNYSVMVVGSEVGHLWAFEYINKDVLARKVYATAVTKVVWLPLKYDPSGLTFMAAFGDGTVRILALNIITADPVGGITRVTNAIQVGLTHEFSLVQSLRFHKGRVLVLKIDEAADTLYTCGGDRLIYGSKIYFDSSLRKPVIEPLSFVTSPFPVVSLDLHPLKNYRFIIAGRAGRVAECRRPVWGDVDSVVSYNQGKLHGRRWFYKSVKSVRRREEDREKRKREKQKDLEELYRIIQTKRDAMIPVDEEFEVERLIERYRKLQVKEDEKELYIPEKPCPVLAIYYHVNPNVAGPKAGQTFFMHIGGYDSGYVYECKYNRSEVGGFHPVAPTPPFKHDVGVKCFLISPDNEFLLFGMTDGNIRIMGRYQPPPIIEERHVSITEKTKPKIFGSEHQVDGGSDSSDDDDDTFNLQLISKIEKKPRKAALPPFTLSEYPYDLTNFWTIPMHDPDRGAVNELAWSYDKEFLISVGEDGAIFAYRWDLTENLTAEESLPAPIVPQIRHSAYPLADIENPNAFTLEELRAKAEEDRLFALSETNKDIIRTEIRKLKVDYRTLQQKNEEIPEQFRFPRSKFELDLRIKGPRQARFMTEINEVYRRYEWEGNRSLIGCDKIEKYFLDNIQTHHQNVKDLEHTVEVHTFRHRILTPVFWDVNSKNKVWMVDEELLLHSSTDDVLKERKTVTVPVKRFYAKDLIGEYKWKKYDIKTIHAIRQLEERLRRRYIRDCEWAALNAIKISDDYEAPEDVAAIQYAAQHMGDYKLKAADAYLGELITTAERRKRVMDLKIMIYESVQEFNGRVRALEEEKVDVIQSCRKFEHEVSERHKYMPPQDRVSLPVVYDIEFVENPDSLFLISETSIIQRQNEKFEAGGLMKRKRITYGDEVEAIREAMQVKKQNNVKRVIHKEGDFLRGRVDPRAPKVILRKLEVASPTVLSYGQQMKAFTKPKFLEGLSHAVYKYRKAFFNPRTEAAIRRRNRILARRVFERDFHLTHLRKLIEYFHQRVIHIRNERIELQLDVKLMSIGLIVLIQELDIVKEYDAAERSVMERLKVQKLERSKAKEMVEKASRRVRQGKAERKKIENSLTKLASEISQVIADVGKYTEYLWKVFRKRIRFSIKATEVDEGNDEGEENIDEEEGEGKEKGESKVLSASSSSSDSASELFKAQPKLDINVCPDNLNPVIYNLVCELRQRKATLETDLSSQNRLIHKLTKDYEGFQIVFQKFEGRLEDIGDEVSSLQLKRQTLINNLKKLVILKSDQLQCLDEDLMESAVGPFNERIKRSFPDINDVIVFPKDGTFKLDNRIIELKAEIVSEKEKQRRARHMILRLSEELHKKENKLARLTEQCQQDMIARFGRIVDLDEVCAAVINLDILDALVKLDLRRKSHYVERDLIQQQIQRTRHHLATVTVVNSEFNTMLAMLEERQRDVDYFLYQQERAETAQNVDESTDKTDSSNATIKLITDNGDVIGEMYFLEDRLINQNVKITLLRETIAACKFKNGVPPIALMSTIPDTLGSKFMTLQELEEYKSLVNKEIETLFMKDNITEHLLQSNSVFPSMDSSQSRSLPRSSKPEPTYGGEEEKILASLNNMLGKSRESPEHGSSVDYAGTTGFTPSEVEDNMPYMEEIQEEEAETFDAKGGTLPEVNEE